MTSIAVSARTRTGHLRCKLTVKFNQVVLDALGECPAARYLGLQETLLLGLVLRMQEDQDHGDCKHGQDDGEGTKCPAPVLSVELLGHIGTGISDNDVGR